MGCCVSSPSSASPYSEQPNSTSHINSSQPQSQSALPRPSTNNSTGPVVATPGTRFAPRHPDSRRSTAARQLTVEPLKLKPPKPWKTRTGDKQWNRYTLDKERQEFFDTQVTGSPQMWQAIRMALEPLWTEGNSEPSNEGLASAQTILEAADIRVTDGDMTKVLYDSSGAIYQLPKHIVSDPQNLDTTSPPAMDGTKEDGDENGHGADDNEVDHEEEVLRRREEKGKAVVKENEEMKVRVRFSDSSLPDYEVSFTRGESVRSISRRIMVKNDLAPPKRIKLVYLGKVLDENRTLLAQDWESGSDKVAKHMINALVFDS